jgi:PAS domain S-box-containing protein
LRFVLETQPVTLIRLGRDGTVLAVNEAGLAVIGAERLEKVLNTSFAALLSSTDRTGFIVFLERVASGHRGSLEVELTTLTGTGHTIQVHAAPHPGAPDGIDSVLVTLRDVTESRRLEQSLVDAMARQGEHQAAHEAERRRLVEDLDRARQGATDSEGFLAQITELETRLRTADASRAAAAELHAAEVQGLTEALDERQRIGQEQAARLERLAELEAQHAELTNRHEAAEALRAALAQELELARLDAEQARVAAAARYDADVAALRDALNAAMNEQAEAAARAGLETDGLAGRISVLETALAAAQTSGQAASARLRELTRGTEQIARRVMDIAAAAGAGSGIPARDLGARLESPVGAAIGPHISLAIMVAAPDALVDAAPEVVQQALAALAANRSAVMRSGQVAVELAAVDVDEGAARNRGGMACGAYLLVAMHVSGDGADQGLGFDLFECADRQVWELAGPGLFTAFESTRLAGGWTWLAREGTAGVVFELYLPRGSDRLEGEAG